MHQWTKLVIIAVASAFISEAVTAQPSTRGGRGGGFGGPNPIMAALDVDQDGSLSSTEIANAAVALKKLDKNGDGKISGEELRPPRGEGRGRRGGGSFVDRIMGFDENGDGKISKSELPERMAQIMDRADSNGDGVLEKSEIEAMAQSFGGRRGDAGGGRGGRPQRPSRPQ